MIFARSEAVKRYSVQFMVDPDVRAFTLIECVFVLLILSVLTLLVVPRFTRTEENTKRIIAVKDLQTLKNAFLGKEYESGYLADMEKIPRFTPVNPIADERRYECLNLRVHSLFCPTNLQTETELGKWREAGLKLPSFALKYDSDARRGWRGPYVSGGQFVETVRSKSAVPPPPPIGGNPEHPLPPGITRLERFPGPRDRRFEKDQTFFERGFYWANEDSSGTSDYGLVGEYALADPWGNPYLLQVPEKAAFPSGGWPTQEVDRKFALRRWQYARLVSAGPDGVLDTPRDLCAGREKESLAKRGDDLVLFLFRTDVFEDLEWE